MCCVLRADYGGYGGYEGGYGARAAPRGKGTALSHSLRCLHTLDKLGERWLVRALHTNGCADRLLGRDFEIESKEACD